MDLTGALQAFSNAGTGYLQGQQTAKDNSARNQMNALAIQGQELNLAQQQLSVKQQQTLSDKAMALFNPNSTPSSGSPTPEAQLPGGAPNDLSQVGKQPAPDFADNLDELAKTAFSTGDLVHGNELMTNAANLRESKFKQQQTQAATELAEAKRQQISHSLVAQTLGAAQDEDEWDQAKMQVLTSPWVTPDEKKNLANLQYSPDTVRMINQTGMNSSQQAAAKMKQLQLDETRRVHDLEQARKDADSARKDAHEQAWEAHQDKITKAGGSSKAPSKADLQAAGVALKGAAPDMDEDSNDFMRAQQSIASRAQQLVANNKALTFDQATNIAAGELVKSGEIAKGPDTHTSIFGVNIPGTTQPGKTTFTQKGVSADAAIPLSKGMKESDLIDGKYYSYGGKTYQVQGGKLHEVH